MTWHQLQSRPDGCVAASMCIIQRWRGQAPTEDAFLAHTPHDDPRLVSMRLPRVRVTTPNLGNEREIALALLGGSVVAITLVSQHYEHWLRRRYPTLVSPHGSFGGATTRLHMVVLIARVRDAYELLDPFFEVSGQPLRIDDDEFVSCFGGHAFVASR